MAQWRDVFLAVIDWILKLLGTLLLAWTFFVSKQAPATVAGAIWTYIILRCCAHLFVAVYQAPQEDEISPNVMAHWWNINLLVVKGILRWLKTLLLAWRFFLSEQASGTVVGVITTYIISCCCGYLFVAVNQASEEFSFSNPDHLRLFFSQSPQIENQIRLSIEMALSVGIITTYFPKDLMATLALCYMVGFCAGLYYLLSVGP